jgi:deazaflavin-dependent oxidoreductase (nitroreductase family)
LPITAATSAGGTVVECNIVATRATTTPCLSNPHPFSPGRRDGGCGREAQWFSNVQANPRVRVYAGSRTPAPATARVLDQQQADRILAAYRGRQPRTWAQLRRVLQETLGAPITDTDTPLPLVELRRD